MFRAALYPEHTISHIPRERLGANGYVADPYVANAPVAGDRFQWHIDADPATWPTYGNLVILYGNPQRTRFSALFCLVPVPMACWCVVFFLFVPPSSSFPPWGWFHPLMSPTHSV